MHIDQLNHCCEQSVRAQAAQTHVIKGVSVHHRYALLTRLFRQDKVGNHEQTR